MKLLLSILLISISSQGFSQREHSLQMVIENTSSHSLNTPITLGDTLSIDSIIDNNAAEMKIFEGLSINITPYRHIHINQIVIHGYRNQLIRMTALIQHGGTSLAQGVAQYTWYFSNGEVFQSRIVDRRKNGDIHIYEITHASGIDFTDPPMTHTINGDQKYHHMDTWQSNYEMNLRCLKNAQKYVNHER